MRIAIGGLMHESNGFNPVPTVEEDFTVIQNGQLLSPHVTMSRTSIGGIIAELMAHDVEVLPTFFAQTQASGTVARRSFDSMLDRILSGVADSGNIDAVCLALHGSMVVEGIDDAEGYLLSKLRLLVGVDLPVCCALDMHATMTEEMIESGNVFVAYQTAPHIDMAETGAKAAQLAMHAVTNGLHLCTERFHLPMLLGGEKSETAVEPMESLIAALRQAEGTEFVLSASYCLGFPWMDSPFAGISALTVGEASHRAVLHDRARDLAAKFWERRFDFHFSRKALPPAQAILAAKQIADDAAPGSDPVIVSDTGDNPTAGASQDQTDIVHQAISLGLDRILIVAVADRDAFLVCRDKGKGHAISIALGRLGAEAGSSPLEMRATIQNICESDGMGVAIVKCAGVTVIITDRRTGVVYDPTFLERIGLNYRDYSIIIVKTGYLSAEYARIASKNIFALSEGNTLQELSELPYRRIPRPIYPLDNDAVSGVP